MSRKAFQAAIALILVVCLVCPFVEMALGCNDSIFMTGHDSESTLAVVILLFELVFALASVLVFLVPNHQGKERIIEEHQRLTSDLDLCTIIPDSSPPAPLRI